jgi:DNA-binding NtrC family response regulator
MGRILIVDDEPGIRQTIANDLRRSTHITAEASGYTEAKAMFASNEYDAVLTEYKMRDGSGLDILRAVQEDDSSTSVVFLTAVGTIDLAVESMRKGAFDFLAKPPVLDTIRATVHRACERTGLLRNNCILRTAERTLEGADDILGHSEVMQSVREVIAKIAPTSCTVLITGETGTGKELVARAIHRNSLRSANRFVAINCAAVTETLVESELFGYERGAFTGADSSRAGLFEAADRGTLFLDEVAEMSPTAQTKLLRVLTDGEIRRVGSTSTRHVDVRVLAATRRNLQEYVQLGRFREDLFFRLAVLPVHLPSLRERKDDLPELCRALTARIAVEMKLHPRTISAAAEEKLASFAFPGNVRELCNLLERALIMGQSAELQPEDFPLQPPATGRASFQEDFNVEQLITQIPLQLDLQETLAQFERALIVRALRHADGVQADAARRLKLSRSALGYKVGKYAIA